MHVYLKFNFDLITVFQEKASILASPSLFVL